jgi:GntR family transcriptional regulator, transcriptional repressor for pyruvate dehydrogenase complex
LKSNVCNPLPSLRFEEIAAHIETMIASGSLSFGDRLPSERRLAAQLKVSRSSIREAIRILDQKGLVEIRRGRTGGVYIRPPSPQSLNSGMALLLRFDRLTLDQISDFRVAIEGHVTAQAARTAQPADIRQLHRRLETTRERMNRSGDGLEAYIEADKAVHLFVAQMAGNPLFSQALEAAMGLKSYFCRFLRLRPALVEANYLDLVDIVRAVGEGRPEAASGATQAHIMRFNALAVDHIS